MAVRQTLHWAGNRPVANGFSAVAAPDIYTSQNGLLEVRFKPLAVSPVQVGDGPSGPGVAPSHRQPAQLQRPKPRPPPRGPPRRYRPHSAAQTSSISPPTCTTTGCTSPPRAQAINVFLSVAPGEAFTLRIHHTCRSSRWHLLVSPPSPPPRSRTTLWGLGGSISSFGAI